MTYKKQGKTLLFQKQKLGKENKWGITKKWVLIDAKYLKKYKG